MTGMPVELTATAGTLRDWMVTLLDSKGGCFSGSAAAVTGAPLEARMSAKAPSLSPARSPRVELLIPMSAAM